MIKKSFEDWCLENNREDILELWDYELNDKSPSEVSYCHTKKVYFKCPKGRHKSELKSIKHFADGGTKYIHCEQCESFAQFIIDEYGKEYLDSIWSDKNEKSPWKYRKCSKQKAYFVCTDDLTHEYQRVVHKQSNGQKCPYCLNRKLDLKRSFGAVHPEAVKLWSDKNKKTPYEYAPGTNYQVWWRCPDGKHDDYKRSVVSAIQHEFRCPKCSNEAVGRARIIDLTGQTFGELTVIKLDESETAERNEAYWICECSCGDIVSIRSSCLTGRGQKTCGNRKIHQRGEGNPNWKDGSSLETRKRKNPEYKEWRSKVMELDDYTCQCCLKRGGDLQVHHIYSFANHEDKRTDISNGITLCTEHHAVGFGDSLHGVLGCFDVTPEQLEEYINNKRKELGIIIPFSINEYIKDKKASRFSSWINKLNSDPIDEDWEADLVYESNELKEPKEVI